jgi:hypothetical protein
VPQKAVARRDLLAYKLRSIYKNSSTNLSYKLMNRFLISWHLLSVAAFCPVSFNAFAVIDANSASNTGAPADGAPWDNVGDINGASGVYIGGGWVLTAAHVGAANINLDGTVFAPELPSLRLTNSDGTSTDLVLFRLTTFPPLPSLSLASTTPAALSQIDMIGFGHIAGSAQTNFGLYSGFYWSSYGAKSWGNNKVNVGGTTTFNAGFGTVTAFITDFTSPGTIGPTSQTSDEAQLAGGDSGGGAFQKNGSVWQLAGILDAEQNQVNQPGSTACYGDNSYMADIATYGNQIVAVLNANPIPNLSIASSGTNTLVCWPDMGVNYNLEVSSSLSNPNWSVLSANQFFTNGQICVQLPTTNGVQLFRLQK